MTQRLLISLVVIPGMLVGPPLLAGEGRTYVRVVGSNSLRPFADAVADRVGKSGKLKRPLVESTGTGGGIRLFCEGLGADHPDIANASRRMKETEYAFCQSRGVTNIVEVKIGYGGVVLAHSKQHPPMSLTRKHLFLALAKEVPDPLCPSCEHLVPNPVKRWKELDPTLPDRRIQVFGPPISSGTREVFTEAVMQAGCEALPLIGAGKEPRELCEAIRDDGAYREGSGNTIVKKLRTNPDAIGIMAYNLFHKHAKELDSVRIEGFTPEPRSIASHQYPLTRPLFFYLKGQHIGKVSGLEHYIAEFTSEKAWGDKGYLVPIGLIPMSEGERRAYAPESL
ncbi:MAG: substrate-binding domain-containing protein [Gammaproteobacteria bacterium]